MIPVRHSDLHRTGPAIWRTKDTDEPITVTGYLGEHDGRHYYRIDGSTTGVPVDDVAWPDEPPPSIPADAETNGTHPPPLPDDWRIQVNPVGMYVIYNHVDRVVGSAPSEAAAMAKAWRLAAEVQP